uniref:Uncharacterized protein n=1 Tax=Panagrolaimus sp. ES5 TaxID=591445 RepID=A0AC34GMB4_9BILA
MSSSQHGILSHGSTSSNNGHVRFDPTTADNSRPSKPPTTPPPDPSKVAAPVVNCPIKDEVVSLNGLFKTMH